MDGSSIPRRASLSKSKARTICCEHFCCGSKKKNIEALPYDRARTSMKKFTMCGNCEREYRTPADRRFHAQPNACPVCGRHLELWDSGGRRAAGNENALVAAATAIREGDVVALKGLGGFQLIVDARNDAAIKKLRVQKHREEKSFAFMVTSMEMAKSICAISDLEQRLLLSSEAPIVLLARNCRASAPLAGAAGAAALQLAEFVAPPNPNLGVMLPYTPLHHLLKRELNFPIVATSGNLTDEPICTEEIEALKKLPGIADFFFVHNRPIVRHVDDSIVRIMHRRELVLRRARGYAPLPIVVSDRTHDRPSPRRKFPALLAPAYSA